MFRKKRASRACDACRRLKEKCDGIENCSRCRRAGRQCRYTDVPRHSPRGRHPGLQPVLSGNLIDDFFDIERIKALERIVRHFTSTEQFDKPHLLDLIASLSRNTMGITRGGQDRRHVTSSVRPVGISSSSMELSHQSFSFRLQQKMQPRLPVIVEAASQFPPEDVALFLVNVFFDYAETNYCYVDEEFLRHKLVDFYSSTVEFDTDDASWVCTLLMVFAMGTQFAHLTFRSDRQDVTTPETSEPDDSVAVTFYHIACRLIPDTIANASLQSVQAFVLLGAYTLPVDAGGLSCTYLGIASRIATQNSMHREDYRITESRLAELRRRIFWTVYTLERRICVFHGRPVSLARRDVNCEYPTNIPGIKPEDRVDTLPNLLAMIRLIDMLESARDFVSAFRQAGDETQPAAAQSMLDLKAQLQNHWQTLPTELFCRDLDPAKPLFRPNIHLHLTYHLVYVFIGRPFILNGESSTSHSTEEDRVGDWRKIRDDLVNDCVQSALVIIDLCQTLHEEVGLAKSSYTEFTSCCAAVLVLLAHRMTTRSRRLQKTCDRGIKFLKDMSVGKFSQHSERLTVEALELALDKLDQQTILSAVPSNKSGSRASAYMKFKNWAASQQTQTRSFEVVEGESPNITRRPPQQDSNLSRPRAS
ncbi:fungal-specific transcription factor domain-containing protein [Camillea tinctor]|nr:fungal-specific transcription factor domain-containing protein [Camillea tinctor]